MLTENQKSVVLDGIAVYGEAQQYIQTAEEVGELLTKISQYRRGRIGKEDVVEEMADVLIMFECLKQMMTISDDELNEMVDKKFAKFESQINSMRN